jgi:hypothetical protein
LSVSATITIPTYPLLWCAPAFCYSQMLFAIGDLIYSYLCIYVLVVVVCGIKIISLHQHQSKRAIISLSRTSFKNYWFKVFISHWACALGFFFKLLNRHSKITPILD